MYLSILVRAVGLEPTRHKHTPLKRACLPIPACSHIKLSTIAAMTDDFVIISPFRTCVNTFFKKSRRNFLGFLICFDCEKLLDFYVKLLYNVSVDVFRHWARLKTVYTAGRLCHINIPNYRSGLEVWLLWIVST